VEQLVDVTAFEVIGDYRLRLTFADGTTGDVDFTGLEWRGRLRTAPRPRLLRTRQR